MPEDSTAQFLMAHSTAFFYGGYLLMFLFFCAWEALAPRTPRTQPRLRRWAVNFLIYALSLLLLEVLSTATLANLSYFTWKNGWGLLNLFSIPMGIQLLLSLALLDLLAYATHFLNHRVPFFWRFHRVHHLDMDFDSSTGFIHHPLESFFTFLIRQPFILLVGPSPLAILIFDTYALAGLFITHANVRIHPWIDLVLRPGFVTPDMHRIHHSTDWDESNSNLGVNLSWWDRAFGTYRPRPGLSPETMAFGLAEYRSGDNLHLGRMLVFPFLKRG